MNLDDLTPEQRAYHEKLQSVGTNVRKPGKNWEATREFRKEGGERIKKTLDEGGNVVTQHARGDRQDVHINAKTLQVQMGMKPTGS